MTDRDNYKTLLVVASYDELLEGDCFGYIRQAWLLGANATNPPSWMLEVEAEVEAELERENEAKLKVLNARMKLDQPNSDRAIADSMIAHVNEQPSVCPPTE